MRQICMEAKPVLYAAGDQVVSEGAVANEMHFLVKGRLYIDVDENGQGGTHVGPPCWFGDAALFADVKYQNTVVAEAPTETLCIERQSIVSLCEEVEPFRVQYEDYRKKVIEDNPDLLRCKNCDGFGHTEDVCPFRTVQSRRYFSMFSNTNGSKRLSRLPSRLSELRKSRISDVRQTVLRLTRVSREQGSSTPSIPKTPNSDRPASGGDRRDKSTSQASARE